MSLVSLDNVSIRFRGPNLLDEVSCKIDQRQRIGLLGRNGAGKSTLMKIISGQLEADSGSVQIEPNVVVSQLPQEVPRDVSGSISEIVTRGMSHLVETEPEWTVQNRVEQIMTRMELNGNAEFASLSSGMKRRVLLAQSIVAEPQLLLLDEPTNHLDIASIRWLETFLMKWRGTILFVTHDRSFLQNLATRILEIDRGNLLDWSCSYEKFLERKEAVLEAEEKQNALFDKKLAEEEAWIRQGIKARRTRNQGRVRSLVKLREERQQRREKIGNTRLQIQSGKRSGNLVAEIDEISFGYDDLPIVQEFSCEIMRGDKIGLIGPNGVGKTTLLRLLLGTLEPSSGRVRLGHNLEIAYFDQLRDTLDDNETVQFNVADGYQNVQVNGRDKHVLGYLQDFLFPPERARTEVKFLSGGERNRLLLAKLFSKTANVLVLDEPTNDLDTETLELLEEKLIEFDGSVLVVSHDRTFLNNVVTSTIVFENGHVKEYDGGYDDWVRQSGNTKLKTASVASDHPVIEKKKQVSNKPVGVTGRPKLKFKEKRELAELPEKIETLEASISEIHETMALPDFYQQSSELIASQQKRLDELTKTLESAFQRWDELEQMS
ncbi:MAG: ATP-binding cassette domain-containing protein [Pirellulaceae bacterium]|nr:ATP-binding cassette domain-containing protein [Pirellulaceae bacterium]